MQDQQQNSGMLTQMSNEEIFMIYHRFLDHRAKLEDLSKTKMLPIEVQTPFGMAHRMVPVDQAFIEKFTTSDYVKTVDSIIAKLSPFCELVKEVDPDITKKIEEFI